MKGCSARELPGWDFCGVRVSIGAIALFLSLLIASNSLLIVLLEDAWRISDHFTLLGLPDSYYEKPFWAYFIPQAEVYGTWASTTVVAASLLQKVIHPAWVLLFSQNVLVIICFVVALSLSKSIVFAATCAVLTVTVPFNFHVYSVHGTTAQGLLLSYFLLTVHASVLLIRRPSLGPAIYLVVAGTLLLLGYETWLDAGVVCLLLGVPVALVLQRHYGSAIAKRFVIYVCGAFALMLIYTAIKSTFGFGSGEGSETDLLFNYESLTAMIVDYASKVVTFSFTALSLVLPPPFAGSTALQMFGGQWMLDQQHGYHTQMQFLTYLNHVFMWRFFAGAYFVLAAALGIWAYVQLWKGRSEWWLWVTVIAVVMLLMGASTHSLVKFRPMHSMPYLGYQVWVNVLGAIALVGVFVESAVRRLTFWMPFMTVTICWTALVWIGLSVRTSLGVYADNMWMGTYPDPAGKLAAALAAIM